MTSLTTTPPTILPPNPDVIPAELKNRQQWVCWRWVWSDAKAGWDKPPINAKTGYPASSTDPQTWTSFEKAADYALRHNTGMGYMFSDSDPLCGIDFDDCRNTDTGAIDDQKMRRILALASYTEVSPSETGLKVFVKAKLPGKGRKNPQQKIELYDKGRFFTVTGQQLDGTPSGIEERQQEVDALYRDLFPEPTQAPEKATNSMGHSHNIDDAELIKKAQNATNGAKFAKLWAGDHSEYPSQSEADIALCSLLAFWTDGDLPRIDALFRQSGLYRPKWDETHGDRTYADITISTVMNTFKGGYRGRDNSFLGPQAAGSVPKMTYLHSTDLGNAQRLVMLHGKDLRYVPAWKQWLVWDGKRWKRDNTNEVYRRALDTVREMYRQAADVEDPDLRKPLIEWALGCESKYRIEAMIALARSAASVVITAEQLDADPWLLNTESGTIDLRSGAIREHRRDDLITKLAPVEYDANADCPTWKRFLSDIMTQSDSLIDFLQRAIGYALTGDTSEQCLFMLWGSGANGKSTYIETIRTLLGDYAQQADFSTFLAKDHDGIRNDIARMQSVRYVSAVEAAEGKKLAEVVIKQLTGQDTITARYLYAEYFEYRPTFKIFLAVNHKPIVKETSNAIWRRMRLIPFTVTFAEERQDKMLPSKLKAELSGILNWAIAGCLAWQKTGLPMPEEVKQATQSYKDEMDTLSGFLSDCCILGADRWVSASALRTAYEQWAKEENGQKELLQGKNWGERLRTRGCVPETRRIPDPLTGKEHKTRGWAGIALADVAEEPTGEDKPPVDQPADGDEPNKAQENTPILEHNQALEHNGTPFPETSNASPYIGDFPEIAFQPVPSGDCVPENNPDCVLDSSDDQAEWGEL